jgi:DNA sulfur modification protein DndE
MNPPVQNIRVSQRGKEALQRLKNRTGIENWNVLCRWAVSASLGMDTPPPRWIAQEESNIDMDWKTFAGDQADILSALIYQSAEKHGESKPEALPAFFSAHLERGINAIQNVRKLSDVTQLSK